jgi:hypothetical protein
VNTGNLPTTANTSLCVKRVTHCTLLDESNNPGTAGEHENGAAQASLGIVLLDRSNNSPPQDAESDTAERRVPSGFAPPCRRPRNCLVQEHLRSGEVKNAVSAFWMAAPDAGQAALDSLRARGRGRSALIAAAHGMLGWLAGQPPGHLRRRAAVPA